MTDEEKKELMKLAFESIDMFPVSLPNMFPISDSKGDSINLPGDFFIKITDVSFKLYILNHTETEIEKQRLKDYCSLVGYIRPILEGKKTSYNHFLLILRGVYPLLKDNNILHAYVDYFEDFFVKDDFYDPLRPVFYAARLLPYFMASRDSLVRLVKTLHATNSNKLENQDYWPMINPIFEKCAKELIDSQKEETGKTFGTYFYGPGNDKLEGILKSQKLWSDRRMIKNQNRKETSQEVSSREYHRWKKNFDSWFKRYRMVPSSLEETLLPLFEKFVWNNPPLPMMSMNFPSDISSKVNQLHFDKLLEVLNQADNSLNEVAYNRGFGTKWFLTMRGQTPVGVFPKGLPM